MLSETQNPTYIPLLGQKVTKTHYDSLGDVYDKLWSFEQDHAVQMIQDMITALDITSSDVIADLGGGTGKWAQPLAIKTNCSTVYCVDPVKSMVDQARARKEIIAVHQSVKEFVSNKENKVTKYIAQRSVHHFEDRANLWSEMYQNLPRGGKLLTVTSSDNCQSYPFPSIVAKWLKAQTSSFEALFSEFKETEFDVAASEKYYKSLIPKRTWFEMIRGRFISSLSQFTDDELEAGIMELDGTLTEDSVEVTVNYYFFVLEKK